MIFFERTKLQDTSHYPYLISHCITLLIFLTIFTILCIGQWGHWLKVLKKGWWWQSYNLYILWKFKCADLFYKINSGDLFLWLFCLFSSPFVFSFFFFPSFLSFFFPFYLPFFFLLPFSLSFFLFFPFVPVSFFFCPLFFFCSLVLYFAVIIFSFNFFSCFLFLVPFFAFLLFIVALWSFPLFVFYIIYSLSFSLFYTYNCLLNWVFNLYLLFSLLCNTLSPLVMDVFWECFYWSSYRLGDCACCGGISSYCRQMECQLVSLVAWIEVMVVWQRKHEKTINHIYCTWVLMMK